MLGLSNSNSRDRSSASSKAKKPKKAKSKSSRSADELSVSSDQDIAPSSRRRVRHQAQIFVADRNFDLSQLSRDLWLDFRQTVQNGTRCIRSDHKNVRYMCTSRSLRDLTEDEAKKTMKYFVEVFQAQNDLASMTQLVQSVVAARVHRRDLLVITPLPSNMYLSDLKKLVMHMSHITVRYYSSCILLGLEFLRHRKIYHGNLSLSSIALDHHGRPQITDFDALLFEKIGLASGQFDALRFATLLSILHCDNMRHFSVAHMHSTTNDPRRKDLFTGICPKCRLTAECLEPKLCDCKEFGSMVRFIRSKIVTKEKLREILTNLRFTWIEADLRYSWTRIPKSEDQKQLDIDLSRSASQLGPVRHSSHLMGDPYEEYESIDSDTEAGAGQTRLSRMSFGMASSFVPTGTVLTLGGTSQGTSAQVIEAKINEAKNERQWNRRLELQQSRAASSIFLDASKRHLLGFSTESMSKSAFMEGTSVDSEWQKAPGQTAGTDKPKSNESGSDSGSLKQHSVALGKDSSKPPQQKQKQKQATLLGQLEEFGAAASPPKSQNSAAAPPRHLRRRQSKPTVSYWRAHWRDDSDDETPLPIRVGGQLLIPQRNCSASAPDTNKNANYERQQINTSTSSSFIAGISGEEDYKSGIFEEFNAYEEIMKQRYFHNTNWDTLENAQPPDGFWFAHSAAMQNYSREGATSASVTASGPSNRTFDNFGDENDRVIGSYFTSRSRFLYSLFG